MSVIHWGYDAGDGKGSILRASEWVGPDGTKNYQCMQKDCGTRVLLYPNPKNDGPDVGADAELTIYGYSDQSVGHPEENFRRVSLTQMNKNEPGVRLSIERGGDQQFDEVAVCFDTWRPGVAWCPFMVHPDYGVLVCNWQGGCNQLQAPPIR